MKKRVDFASNLTHKVFYIIIALVILGAIVVGVHAATTGLISPVNPGHNSSQVFISVGSNKYITLQDAIDEGYLLGQNFSSIRITLLPVNAPYELANQIIISFKGQKMTLQEAVNTNVFINNVLQVGYSYSTNVLSGGDIGANVNINTTNGNMTLQNAINTGLKLLSSACLSGFVCPDGQNIGSPCYPSGNDGLCMNAGTITSSATCVGYSDVALGTSCIADGTKTCNGKGLCEGWIGYSCGASSTGPGCPFGVSSDGAYSCCNSNQADNVGLFSYCNYNSRSCSYGSCSTSNTDYAWNMKPEPSGNNYAACARPYVPPSGNGGSGGGQPTSTTPSSPSDGGGGPPAGGWGNPGGVDAV
jgi:hypothetical protein